MSESHPYEVLGKFYLGRTYDLEQRKLNDINLLYDSRDLVTHGICVGMTGSGKTGLCISLLEEAAIDGIPVICVDPKGDLGNLLLTFPDLRTEDFEPWVEESEAARQGIPKSELAERTAKRWREGLAAWDQDGERIQKLRDSVDFSIYTPGSNVGLPLTVLKSFDAPTECVLQDAETYRERISSSASALLTLLGMNVDPLTSREHILLSRIFDHAWRQGKDLELGEIIRQIQTPPIDRVGVVDLETFMPTNDRVKLAMTLNNLLASPAFEGWLEGESLDIKKLLYQANGRPRISIISIAHLNDTERMFFVTILLSELLNWTRNQPGTSSLRALFYMDEVFGYFPPSAKPPSKMPMLTLLKQARAFGVGVMLATQNPVDLDYKGLGNIGTWFLGRLQTQRDKDRVLEGLEGAAAQAGSGFDRRAMDQMLSALGSRVFLMNNVHRSQPEVFQSRWALSYLGGPLSRQSIQKLMAPKKQARVFPATPSASSSNPPSTGDSFGQTATTSNPSSIDGTSGGGSPNARASQANARPIVPAGIQERFLVPTLRHREGSRQIYRPALLGQSSLHYVRATHKVDHWKDIFLLVHASDDSASAPWSPSCELPPDSIQLAASPENEFEFDSLPSAFLSAKNYTGWERDLKEHLYRSHPLVIFHSKALKQTSRPDQTECDARIELAHAAHEARDAAVKTLRDRFETRLRSLDARIATAQQRLDKEKMNEKSHWMQSTVTMVTSVLGAVMSNKVASKTNVNKVGTAARGLGRVANARGNVERANDALQSILDDKFRLEEECERDVAAIEAQFAPENIELERIEIPARKSDTRVQLLALTWVPWQIGSNGIATPLVELPETYLQSII